MMTLDEARAGVGAAAVGIARAALEAAVAYAKERKQFGKPIAQQQAISNAWSSPTNCCDKQSHAVCGGSLAARRQRAGVVVNRVSIGSPY